MMVVETSKEHNILKKYDIKREKNHTSDGGGDI
jgi:hypothetical protein